MRKTRAFFCCTVKSQKIQFQSVRCRTGDKIGHERAVERENQKKQKKLYP